MARPRGFRARAFNIAPESENRIHSDEIAQRFGFSGGLVPGVSVSAYLMQPAIEAWGVDWLERGSATAKVAKPVYDGEAFDVELTECDPEAYRAILVGEDGTKRAEASVQRARERATPPQRRGDDVIGEDLPDRPPASREAFEALQASGARAIRTRWRRDARVGSYFAEPNEMPALLRPDREYYANPAFVLGLSNWVLAANVYLPAWLHLQTEHENFAAIPPDSEVTAELAIVDLFEKKGHRFVDADVDVYLPDDEPAASIRLRAIYALRGS